MDLKLLLYYDDGRDLLCFVFAWQQKRWQRGLGELSGSKRISSVEIRLIRLIRVPISYLPKANPLRLCGLNKKQIPLLYVLSFKHNTMQMKKPVYILLILSLLISFSALSAQEVYQKDVKKKEKPMNRIILGGGIGAQFGDYTVIDVSPMVGYKVTERFIPGAGFSYQYIKINNPYGGEDYETDILGWSLFSRYYIFREIFAHAEYQQLYYDRYNWITGEETRVSVPGYLIGGGYSASLGGRFSSSIIVLFNLNDVYDYPYSNPIIRIGFQVGL